MSRKTLLTAVLIFALIAFLSPLGRVSQAAAPSSELQARLQSSADGDEIPIIVTLHNDVNVGRFTHPDKNVRRRQLVQALKDQAASKHKPLIDLLESKGVSPVHSLWIINGLALRATPVVIRELAGRAEVESIRLDRAVTVPPVTSGTVPAPNQWNIDAIHAPDLWKLGYTGQGVVVANMDTGVDVNHQDLKTRWRGGNNSWYDVQGQFPTPDDIDGHGTATMGLMVGGNAGGTAIGVAPGATWIAVKIYYYDVTTGQTLPAQASDIHKGFQWLLNPSGDPANAPDVVNNSWDLENTNSCDTEFENDIQTLLHAGIAVVFSAGNYGRNTPTGPNPRTSVSPANNLGAFSVGATDGMNAIANFSSTGPSPCGGSIFPNVVAPGMESASVGLYTAAPTFGGAIPDGYTSNSIGTSFSSPHAAGAIALLLSAFPDKKVADLESALESSAFDLGKAGPDNTYGNGLLDVSKAWALLTYGQLPPVAVNHAYAVSANKTLTVGAPGVLKSTKGKGPFTAILVSNVSHGSLTLLSNGSFTYKPTTRFTGVDKFTYQASNGANSNTATVTITVKPIVKPIVNNYMSPWSSWLLPNSTVYPYFYWSLLLHAISGF